MQHLIRGKEAPFRELYDTLVMDRRDMPGFSIFCIYYHVLRLEPHLFNHLAATIRSSLQLGWMKKKRNDK